MVLLDPIIQIPEAEIVSEVPPHAEKDH